MDRIRNIRFRPCGGYFLQGGARALALIDFGLALFSGILISSEIVLKLGDWQAQKETEPLLYYLRPAFWSIYFVVEVSIMALSIYLFKSSKMRDDEKCKRWIIVSTIINLIFVSLALYHNSLFPISRIIIGFLVVSYGGFNSALKGLTDAEVEEFEKGNPPEPGANSKDELESVQLQAFNKDFEISITNLEIDTASPLGSGAFGTVYRAKLLTETPPVVVALKTVNPNADNNYFKTLLGELKIMTFLTRHDNVVNLIGACTANIKDKKLFIVVEFCPYGNLHEYLKCRRGLFISLVKDGKLVDGDVAESCYENIRTIGNTSCSISTVELVKWAYETAKGMQFLAEKKVIHGDLAARNILLAKGKIAKITDFGLSRKLYQFTKSEYVKKDDKLLPWRWMAIESLKNTTFSTKSDVWSYGVTLWEMFSLSEIPFPGYTWNTDFICRLEAGLRMHQPHYATDELYDLMLSCWQPSPENRPSFEEIVNALFSIQTQMVSTENIQHASYENIIQNHLV